MAKTQKNKATAKHLGMLKAKLAKLKKDLLDEQVRGALRGGAAGRSATRAAVGDPWRRRRWGRAAAAVRARAST